MHRRFRDRIMEHFPKYYKYMALAFMQTIKGGKGCRGMSI